MLKLILRTWCFIYLLFLGRVFLWSQWKKKFNAHFFSHRIGPRPCLPNYLKHDLWKKLFSSNIEKENLILKSKNLFIFICLFIVLRKYKYIKTGAINVPRVPVSSAYVLPCRKTIMMCLLFFTCYFIVNYWTFFDKHDILFLSLFGKTHWVREKKRKKKQVQRYDYKLFSFFQRKKIINYRKN